MLVVLWQEGQPARPQDVLGLVVRQALRLLQGLHDTGGVGWIHQQRQVGLGGGEILWFRFILPVLGDHDEESYLLVGALSDTGSHVSRRPWPHPTTSGRHRP